jgi:hypothetical protein
MPATTRQLVRRIFWGEPAGRALTVFPDDVFITSFPRSGNTWTRFVIGNLLAQDSSLTFNNLEGRVPEIYANSDRKMRRLPRPRVLKSHESFDGRYPHVIYIVRDPRDVAISKYHYNIATGRHPADYPIEEFLPRFISGEFDEEWGTWAQHVTGWLSNRQRHDDFLLLRYEDMKLNSERELLRVAAFLHGCGFENIDCSPDRLEQAIEHSTPERMRSLERQQGFRWTRLRKEREIKGYVAVRKAISGGWISLLPQGCVAQIESAWGDVMTQLSYPLQSVCV